MFGGTPARQSACLHEEAHRFHVADLASYHIEVYAEMVIEAVAVLAASEGIGLSIKTRCNVGLLV